MPIFLVAVPVINIVIIAICCVVSAAKHEDRRPTSYTPTVVPEDPPRPVETIQKQEYPDIADQFDGRLTNIVKNPMKGIL
jgi:hypothetical protein